MADISIRDVVKRFGDTTALDGVSLEVGDGEIVALLGPSGCGKTTLLRCVAGLESPSSGLIELGGDTLFGPRISVPPYSRNISMVFQSYALWPHMTVMANVAYGLRIQKLPKAVVSERVSESLHLTGLDGLGDRYPAQLSGGQQQRVAVARAIALRADVILFDEPLSNLDLKLREEVRLELRRVIRDLNLTAIYVTHDVGEAVVIADRIAIMSAGRIVQLDRPEGIYHRSRTEFAARFVGNVNIWPAELGTVDGQAHLVVNEQLTLRSERLVRQASERAGNIRVMIRPESLRIRSGEGSGAQTGTVRNASFLGQVTAFTVEIGAMRLQVVDLSRPDSKLDVGSRCVVEFDEDDCVILDDG